MGKQQTFTDPIPPPKVVGAGVDFDSGREFELVRVKDTRGREIIQRRWVDDGQAVKVNMEVR